MEDALNFELGADELGLFLQETDECLQTLESSILHLEHNADIEMLNTAFRAAHTLKAMAAMIGHDRMAKVTHALETIFDTMRQHHRFPTKTIADDLLPTVDALRGLRDEVEYRQRSDIDLDVLLIRLGACVSPMEPSSLQDATQPSLQQLPGRTTAQEIQAEAYQKMMHPIALQAGALDKTVRISIERLDMLMDMVGELVTGKTRLLQIGATLRNRYGEADQIESLNDTIGHLNRVINQLQDEVMQARMLPIAQLFDKFPRLVRDVAHSAGKQVNLIMEGIATELDRSIIETIGSALTHLLRNAVDHGIESAELRAATGKPPVGTVSVSAEHVEGQVVITIQDDGTGIDPERTRRAAIRRGLILEEDAARMSDQETMALLFLPGISTAETVTETSGRGVGLDVVQTDISRAGGSVTVESVIGQGATFRITLPLTLAIMQTMLVALGVDVYAIPMRNVVESLYFSEAHVHSIKGKPVISWRDRVLPLLSMRDFFSNPSVKAHQRRSGKPAVVVVSWGTLQVGLIADMIIGKQEIVAKPFGPIIGRVEGLAGCTIMGDGRVALIIDVPSLVTAATQSHNQTKLV